MKKITRLSYNYIKITAVLINYYMHCPREAWLYGHSILGFQKYYLLELGKFLHAEYLGKKETLNGTKTEILLENIKLDYIDSKYVIEYKKKNSDEKAATYQLLFYLFILKNKYGINRKGLLKFKESKHNLTITLTPEYEKTIRDILKKIHKLLQTPIPPAKLRKNCYKCAYYMLCFV